MRLNIRWPYISISYNLQCVADKSDELKSFLKSKLIARKPEVVNLTV